MLAKGWGENKSLNNSFVGAYLVRIVGEQKQ